MIPRCLKGVSERLNTHYGSYEKAAVNHSTWEEYLLHDPCGHFIF